MPHLSKVLRQFRTPHSARFAARPTASGDMLTSLIVKANNTIQSEFRFLQRRQHPPANEQPTHKHIPPPPVRSNNAHEDSTTGDMSNLADVKMLPILMLNRQVVARHHTSSNVSSPFQKGCKCLSFIRVTNFLKPLALPTYLSSIPNAIS